MSPGGPKKSGALAWFGGLKREARFGAAALFSSAILIGALAVNHWRNGSLTTANSRSRPPTVSVPGPATVVEVSPADPPEDQLSPPPVDPAPQNDPDVLVTAENQTFKDTPPPSQAEMPLPSPTLAGESNASELPPSAPSLAIPETTPVGELPPASGPAAPIAASEFVADLLPPEKEIAKPVTPDPPVVEIKRPVEPIVAAEAPPLAVVEIPKATAQVPMPASTLPPISPTPETSMKVTAAPAPVSDGDWETLPNIGTPGMIESSPPIRSVKDATNRAATFSEDAVADFAASAPPKTVVKDDPPAEVSLHKVQRGENFWSISKYYYNSGRYYKALYAANRDKATAIDKLYVGTTIRVPPPEQLNFSLVEPVPPTVAPASKRLTNTGNRSQLDVALPVDEVPAESLQLGSTKAKRAPATLADPDEPPVHSDLPIYKVKSTDTFRSIARDTLGNSRRYDEILQLNRDVIDDQDRPTPGQILRLPNDARVSQRRGRP